jgi:hypothetical protein
MPAPSTSSAASSSQPEVAAVGGGGGGAAGGGSGVHAPGLFSALLAVAPEELQVAEVDEQARGLADDEHRIAAVDGVGQQRGAAGHAEVPEGGRDHTLLDLLAAAATAR